MGKFFRTSSLHGQTILTRELGEERSFYGHASGIEQAERLSLAKGEYWHIEVKYFDNDLGQYRKLCLRLNRKLEGDNLWQFRDIAHKPAGLKQYLVQRKLVGYFPGYDTEPKVEDMGLDYRRVELNHCVGWGMRPLKDHLTTRYLEHLTYGADAKPDIHDTSDPDADNLYPQLKLTYNVDADKMVTGQLHGSRGSNYVRVRVEVPVGDRLAFCNLQGQVHFYQHDARYDTAEVREFFSSGNHGLTLTVAERNCPVPVVVPVHCGNDHFGIWLTYRPCDETAFTELWLPTVAVAMDLVSPKTIREVPYLKGVCRLMRQFTLDVSNLYGSLKRSLEELDLSLDPTTQEMLPKLQDIRDRLLELSSTIPGQELGYVDAVRFFQLWRELCDLFKVGEPDESKINSLYSFVYNYRNVGAAWSDGIGPDRKRPGMALTGHVAPPERNPTEGPHEIPLISPGPTVPSGYGAWHKLLVALGLRKK